MTVDDLKGFYGTSYNFAHSTGLARKNFYNWDKWGYIPDASQLRIQFLTDGKLKADLTKTREKQDAAKKHTEVIADVGVAVQKNREYDNPYVNRVLFKYGVQKTPSTDCLNLTNNEVLLLIDAIDKLSSCLKKHVNDNNLSVEFAPDVESKINSIRKGKVNMVK